MPEQPIPSWPNLPEHWAAWDEAKAELGQDAGVQAIARRAQEILVRMRMPEEDESEQARR